MSESTIIAIAHLFLPVLAMLAMIKINFSKEKEIMRIDFGALAKFTAFIIMLTIFRVLKTDMDLDLGWTHSIPSLPPEIDAHRWTLGLVFWEDMFFAVPMYYLQKYMTKKTWLRRSIIVGLSVLFGLGHTYEGGYQTAVIMSFMPYFVTLRYGKKYGFGTTMCAHVLYDFATCYFVVLLPTLLS